MYTEGLQLISWTKATLCVFHRDKGTQVFIPLYSALALHQGEGHGSQWDCLGSVLFKKA